ncbi:MAG: hypothetical protein ACKODX_14670 [Gemmata sp.]
MPVPKVRHQAGEELEFGHVVPAPPAFISEGGGALEWGRPLGQLCEARAPTGGCG